MPPRSRVASSSNVAFPVALRYMYVTYEETCGLGSHQECEPRPLSYVRQWWQIDDSNGHVVGIEGGWLWMEYVRVAIAWATRPLRGRTNSCGPR